MYSIRIWEIVEIQMEHGEMTCKLRLVLQERACKNRSIAAGLVLGSPLCALPCQPSCFLGFRVLGGLRFRSLGFRVLGQSPCRFRLRVNDFARPLM